MAIDFTKPVRTKRGFPVTIITTEGRGDYPVIGYIGDSCGLCSWTINGKSHPGFVKDTDLENIPQKVKGWINIYPGEQDEVIFTFGSIFASRDIADKRAGTERIACIEIEVEIQ